jgi:hypothetical protein
MSAALEQLETLLPELPSAVERRQIGESLGKTAEAIKDSTRQIQRLIAVVEIARETGFNSDRNQAAALNDLIDASKDAAEMMLRAETADQLRSVQEAYRDFNLALVQVDRQLRPHWRRVVERDFTPLSAIGSLLGRIDSTSNLGQRLIACGREAEQISDRIAAEALRDAIVRLRQEREKLEAERISVTKEPEVDEFLNALAEGDATLQLVTERVYSWLKKNGALDRFKITPRS